MGYAIKVPFEDGELFVTTNGVLGLKTLTFDTEKEAEDFRKNVFPEGLVVEYKDNVR